MTSQERLVSIFLEGLSSKELHATLYMKHHKNLNQCIHNTIDYDDNCDKELKGKDMSSKTSANTSSVASQVKEIMKGVMEKMQCLYGMPKLPSLMDVQLFGVTLTRSGATTQLRNATIALDS